jgi:dTDP-4-dehydrorhamnose 3,5-epimerase
VRVVPTGLPEVLVIEPEVHRDNRGFLLETYHLDRYREAGMHQPFIQDNHSRSLGGTIRGLHLQIRRPQAKLVRVIEGEIYDVAVDVRRGSPTFGRWIGVTLSAENFRQCYVPVGFAHGFAVLSAVAQVEYKCTELYDPGGEIGVRWDDPTVSIAWPISQPTLSPRDSQLPTLIEADHLLPPYDAEDVATKP